jgi:Protein of unknown function DUF262/Protein of unknown function (DUF1524)
MNNVFTVEELFAGRLFRVPDYQRGYAWETSHRAEFLDDLELLAPNHEHYTGTVVLHERAPDQRRLDSEGKNYQLVDVVDGQQRLTTILLLLDSIRRTLSSLDTETASTLGEGIKRSYIAAAEMNGQPLYKLTLNSDCDHYFKTVTISDSPGPEGPQISSERRLLQARSELAAYLAEHRGASPAGTLGWLTDLYLKVTNQLKLSLYTVEDAGDVGVIFEVMNNRGKPLSELDKVKNYLLYAASRLLLTHDLDAVINNGWAEILRQLMAADLTKPSDEDQLLRAHWLTTYNPKSRDWHGSKSIKSGFALRAYSARHPDMLGDLTDYTEGLRAACTGYCDAQNPGRGDSFMSLRDNRLLPEIIHWSEKLVRVNVVAPFLPLLMATRNRFATDPDKYLELVKMCEVFTFRVYSLSERRSDAGQNDLFRLGYKLNNEALSFDEALEELKGILLYFCSANRFREDLRDEDFNWYEWKGLKYFLYEYEEHLGEQKKAAPKVPWTDVQRRDRADTIEHILPQTPNDRYWTKRFDKRARQIYTHSLGNLSLTKDNSAYGRKPFDEKRGTAGSGHPCYAESSFFMERELTGLDEWTPASVEDRRERLIQWAEARWHVDAPDAGAVTGAEAIGGENGDDEFEHEPTFASGE